MLECGLEYEREEYRECKGDVIKGERELKGEKKRNREKRGRK